MLGIRYFICSLVLGFFFSAPQDYNGASVIIDSQAEIITWSYHTNHQALIVNRHLGTHRGNSSFKTFKIAPQNWKIKQQQPIAQTYSSKLLYLELRNIIPLKLTTRTRIFPFHSFT